MHEEMYRRNLLAKTTRNIMNLTAVTTKDREKSRKAATATPKIQMVAVEHAQLGSISRPSGQEAPVKGNGAPAITTVAAYQQDAGRGTSGCR